MADADGRAATPNGGDFETAVTGDDRLELRVWLRLLTCCNLIERGVRRNLRDTFDTTLPRFDLLAQLDRAPEGLTMGALSRRLMVSNGNVTGLINRLVEEGLVARRAAKGDRRTQLVKLTAAGGQAFDGMGRGARDVDQRDADRPRPRRDDTAARPVGAAEGAAG